MARLIGIDFGTTNSVVATLAADGAVRTTRLAAGPAAQDVFRSVLCFWAEEQRGSSKLRHAAGPAAIQSYLDDPLDSRLIMSMKSYLAQASFTQTRIFGRPFGLDQLIALLLRALLAGDDATPARIVAGRPVRFAGDHADDVLGEQRLRAAYATAGLGAIDVALEPEAAGYRFARTLDREATVLVGDFGGGTSDFSILRFEPGQAAGVTPLGHSGVGVAGDVFDFRIIDQVISPLLGRGDTYMPGNTPLPVPPEYFASFARWHRLSLMRNPRTLREIGEVAAQAAHPERLRRLLTLIEDELGYQLYQTVSATKAALSHAETARLQFSHKDFAIDLSIARADFEAWIAPDLARMDAAIEQVMQQSGLGPDGIDHVFLTGGTSFVPAVRQLFVARFGPGKVSAGGEFVSVAEGLALICRDRAGR